MPRQTMPTRTPSTFPEIHLASSGALAASMPLDQRAPAGRRRFKLLRLKYLRRETSFTGPAATVFAAPLLGRFIASIYSPQFLVGLAVAPQSPRFPGGETRASWHFGAIDAVGANFQSITAANPAAW